MSWQTQGRQYHMWFGHGSLAEDGAADPAEKAVAEVGRVLPKDFQIKYNRHISAGGAQKLAAAIRVWAAASHLDAALFRSRVVGNRLPAKVAERLQDVGRILAGTNDNVGIQRGRDALATAVLMSGRDWRQGFSHAASTALYAARMGKIVDKGLRPDFNVAGLHSRGSLRVGQSNLKPVALKTADYDMCHEKCSDMYVGRGYRSDAPLLYHRCMSECGAFK